MCSSVLFLLYSSLAPFQIEDKEKRHIFLNLVHIVCEGSEPYLIVDGRRLTGAFVTIFEYTHEEGGCSITGGPVYRGGVIPSLEGAFIFADYCAGEVRAIRVGEDGQFANEYDLRIEIDNPISFGVDASGEVYVLSQGGKILLLVNDQ